MSTSILNMTIEDPPEICAAAMSDPRSTSPIVELAWRNKLIREAAYFRSQQRRSGSGNELEDWLAAEWQVDESLGRHRG